MHKKIIIIVISRSNILHLIELLSKCICYQKTVRYIFDGQTNFHLGNSHRNKIWVICYSREKLLKYVKII